MASATTANVRVISSRRTGRRTIRYCEVYNVTAGGATNQIPASAFGLDVIESCSNAYDAYGEIGLPAVPTQDGAYVLLFDGTTGAGVDNSTEDTPLGIYLTVTGY